MNDDIANSPLARQKYIETFVDKIYDNEKLSVLFTEPRNKFKQYALDMFLNTNLSYEQIDESFFALIEERKKTYVNEKRRNDICTIVENYYFKYEEIFTNTLDEYKQLCLNKYMDTDMSIEEIGNAIAEEIKKKKELLDELKEKDLDKDVEKLDNEEKVEVQEIESEKEPDEEEKGINKSDIAMAALIGVVGAVKEEANGPEIFNPVNVNPPKTSIVLGEPITKTPDTIQPQKTSSELKTMLADKPAPIEVTPVNALEKPAQLIKTNNDKNNSANSNTQSGSVSIFSIGIAILSIAALVLIAMILNLLLK